MGAARLNKNGDNPTDESGASRACKVAMPIFVRRLVRDAPLTGSHATTQVVDHFLPGYPVVLQKITVRRSGLIELLTFSISIRPSTNRDEIPDSRRMLPYARPITIP